MILTFHLDLDGVMVSQHAKHGQWSFRSNIGTAESLHRVSENNIMAAVIID